MENIDIIAILLTIIAVFIAIFIFRRILIWIALIIVLAVIGYFILQDNNAILTTPSYNNNNLGYLEKFKNHYCDFLYDKDDSLMCNLIVYPIYNDILKTYDRQELIKMNKKQFTELLLKTAIQHKKEIFNKLKQERALYLWEDFKLDLENKNFY